MSRALDARWRPTAALARALVTAAMATAGALLLGDPSLVVIGAPFVLLVGLGLLHRPAGTPRIEAGLGHQVLHEGQGTTARLEVTDANHAEVLTRAVQPAPYVVARPQDGRLAALLGDGPVPEIELGPRRWGRRLLGEERVALFTPWAGYRFGPVTVGARLVRVLPGPAPYDSRAEVPQPLGLVGAHRSRRRGSGTELDGIRPFQPGDRLRRVNWRVSLRTGDLHVVTSRAEEDSGVLLVVDALADHGTSGGIDGAASSLDVAVRAASAIAEHHVRTGDRVALRVIGRGREHVGYGTGSRHLHRIQHTLATIRPGELDARAEPSGLQLGVTGGTVVLVLSPMLAESVGTAAATLTRRGVPVLVVDTLPADVQPAVPEGTDPALATLAWRMRSIERRLVLDRLAGLGCPVVAWQGPGTIDRVLRSLARRAARPRVTSR